MFKKFLYVKSEQDVTNRSGFFMPELKGDNAQVLEVPADVEVTEEMLSDFEKIQEAIKNTNDLVEKKNLTMSFVNEYGLNFKYFNIKKIHYAE